MENTYVGKTIDITPKWSALLPLAVEALKNPNLPAEERKEITKELQRLANFVDNLNNKN
jgi:truncated hemoglobin YjbI